MDAAHSTDTLTDIACRALDILQEGRAFILDADALEHQSEALQDIDQRFSRIWAWLDKRGA